MLKVATVGSVSLGICEAFAEASSREFLEGDCEIEVGPTGSFNLVRSLKYPVSITQLEASDCSIHLRRSQKHIRANPIGLRMIWVVHQGAVHLTRSAGAHTIGPGEVAFIDTSARFRIKTVCDDKGEYKSTQLLVPSYLFFPYLQEADKLSQALTMSGPAAGSVDHVLRLLEREGNWISKALATHLTHSLLASLSDVLEQQNVPVARRERISIDRFLRYRSYILRNLSDPNFSLATVASHFGISVRYLGYVFEENRVKFSHLLWDGRIENSLRLLQELSPAVPIKEIAVLSGFKSAAHFSRLFKRAYGITPSLFRTHRRREHQIIIRGTAGLSE